MRTRRTKRRYGAAPPWTAFVRVHERSGEVWRNSRYFVEVTRIPVEALDVPVIHLQIESNDHRPIHNWRDFQRIKTEILGEEEEALELYPAESCLVDESQRLPPVVHSRKQQFSYPFAGLGEVGGR